MSPNANDESEEIITWNSYLVPPNDCEDESESDLQYLVDPEFLKMFSWIPKLLDEKSCTETTPIIPNTSPEFTGEFEERGVEITNFHPETSENEIRMVCSPFGAIDSVDVSGIRKGKIVITFFDLRQAIAFRKASLKVRDRAWFMRFAPPPAILDRKHPPNNGTLVIFNSLSDIPKKQIRAVLSPFGAIRDIRSSRPDYNHTKATDTKGEQRFVEFWDTRDCEKARHAIRTVNLFGRKISADFSRPGGCRRNPTVFLENRMPSIARTNRTEKPSLEITTPLKRSKDPDRKLDENKVCWEQDSNLIMS
jgi:RNA recognition motif-containing protein